MLAHQLGYPLPKPVMYGIWNWEKLWKESAALRHGNSQPAIV
jgi:hypothetical protein